MKIKGFKVKKKKKKKKKGEKKKALSWEQCKFEYNV